MVLVSNNDNNKYSDVNDNEDKMSNHLVSIYVPGTVLHMNHLHYSPHCFTEAEAGSERLN